MNTHEKQRRGFMGIYRAGAGNGTQELDTAVKASKPMSRSWGRRKSSTRNEIEHARRGEAEVGNLVEARKSVSHLETNLPSVAAFLQVKVLATDMPEFMQVHAFRCARRTYDSLEKFSTKHMAYNMKKVSVLPHKISLYDLFLLKFLYASSLLGLVIVQYKKQRKF